MKKIFCLALSTVILTASVAFASGEYSLNSPYNQGTITFDNIDLGAKTTGNYPQAVQTWRAPLREVTNSSVTTIVEDADVVTYNHEVVADPENPDNHYLQFNPISTGGSLYYDIPGGNGTEGTLEYTMDIKVNTNPTTARNGLYFRNTWDASSNAVIVKLMNANVAANDEYYIQLSDDANHNWGGTIAANLKIGTWYKLHVTINSSVGKYVAWVTNADGKTMGAGKAYKTVYTSFTPHDKLTTIEFVNDGNGAGYCIDNIDLNVDQLVIKSQPEITVDDSLVTATASVKKGLSGVTPDSPALILAVYDNNGAFLGTALGNNNGEVISDFTYGTKTDLTCSITKPATDFTARAYLWTSANSAHPMCDPAVYPAAE